MSLAMNIQSKMTTATATNLLSNVFWFGIRFNERRNTLRQIFILLPVIFLFITIEVEKRVSRFATCFCLPDETIKLRSAERRTSSVQS